MTDSNYEVVIFLIMVLYLFTLFIFCLYYRMGTKEDEHNAKLCISLMWLTPFTPLLLPILVMMILFGVSLYAIYKILSFVFFDMWVHKPRVKELKSSFEEDFKKAKEIEQKKTDGYKPKPTILPNYVPPTSPIKSEEGKKLTYKEAFKKK